MSVRRWMCVSVATVVLLSLSGCSARSANSAGSVAPPRTTGTLYHRIGGYDALAAMTDDFLRPCVYVGQDMETAHQGLGITTADWDRAVQHLGPC